jgi:hypothetical protein
LVDGTAVTSGGDDGKNSPDLTLTRGANTCTQGQADLSGQAISSMRLTLESSVNENYSFLLNV